VKLGNSKISSTRFRLVGLAIASVLVVAGCGSDDAGSTAVAPAEQGTQAETTPAATEAPAATPTPVPSESSPEDIATVDAITIEGAFNTQPVLNANLPISVTFPTFRLLQDGDGPALEVGQRVAANAVTWRGDTGEQLYSTWETGSTESFSFGAPEYGILSDGLVGAHVGARLLIANPSSFAGEPITVVSVFDIVDSFTVPTRAEGVQLETPETLAAAGLPVVTLADNGAPSIEIPEGYEPPTELVAKTLIEGDGPVVQPNSFLTVHYTGWLLNGTVFDSSWNRNASADFPLQSVIPGWREGLAGQHVGSQVLLVIPPDLAYGSDDLEAIPANSTLVFVVDILNAD